MTESEVRNLFGFNLKRIRKSKNLSQMELADKLEMHFTFISDIENGKKWVSPETIAKIASYLNVEPYQFFIPAEYVPKPNLSIKAFADELSKAFETIKSHYVV